MRPILIAEVKTQSPFGYRSSRSFLELLRIACEHGDIVSIHTDPRWGGSWELLQDAFNRLHGHNKPILAKGIHETDQDLLMAAMCGARYTLVVGRIPPEPWLSDCWLEPTDHAQLATFPPDATVVWNQRDLKTGGFRGGWAEARRIHNGPLICASMIRSWKDVPEDAYGVIVGEHLEEFVSSSP